MKIHVLILAIIASISITMGSIKAISKKEHRIQLEETIKAINTAFIEVSKEGDKKQRIENLKNIIQPNHLPRTIRKTLQSLYGNDTSTNKIFSYDAAQETFKELTAILTNFTENPDINNALKLIGQEEKEQLPKESLTKIIQDLSITNERIKNIKFTLSDKYYTRYAAELLFCYGANILHAIVKIHDLLRFLAPQMDTFRTAQSNIKEIADQERKTLKLLSYSSINLS